MLKALKDKSEEAHRMVIGSPMLYDRSLDGVKVENLRHQLIGEYKGLRYLSNLLTQREEELRKQTKQQDEQK